MRRPRLSLASQILVFQLAIVLGALIIGSLVNGLALLSQGTDVSEMVEGVVLLIAVTVDALVRRAQQRTGR